MNTTFRSQLWMTAIFTILLGCQALWLKTPSNTWFQAASAHWWLEFVYFGLASIAGERIARYFDSRAKIASPTSQVE